MEGLWNMLALIGACAVGACILTLIVWFCTTLRKILRVAKHYYGLGDEFDRMADKNHFVELENKFNGMMNRMYIAERNASNAKYQISCHAKDYKHTKTAKKVKVDKERKQREQEYQHDADVRGCGDGM